MARFQVLQYFIDEIDKYDYLSTKAEELADIIGGDPRDYAIIADSLDKLYPSPYRTNKEAAESIRKAPEFISNILSVNKKELNKIITLYETGSPAS